MSLDFNGNYDLMLDAASGYYDEDDEEVCPKCGRELVCGICQECEKSVDAEK